MRTIFVCVFFPCSWICVLLLYCRCKLFHAPKVPVSNSPDFFSLSYSVCALSILQLRFKQPGHTNIQTFTHPDIQLSEDSKHLDNRTVYIYRSNTLISFAISAIPEYSCSHEMTDIQFSLPQDLLFREPEKRIHDEYGLRLFQSSTALVELQKSLSTITSLVEGVQVPRGVFSINDLYTDDEIEKYSHELFDLPYNAAPSDGNTPLKPCVQAVVSLLRQLSTLVDCTPPLPGPRRYGNMACRDWHRKLDSQLNKWMHEFIGPLYSGAHRDQYLLELQWYISNAFGSMERLDYGTGHELNYLAFLTGLWKVGILPRTVNGSDFLIMFGHYYNLTRKLITTYTLEPAGSHGVWGLDDHFHIIYILGSSQLLKQDKTTTSVLPKYVNNRSIVYQYSTTNMYFNAIAFIYKVKKGAFFEHSPILYDISSIKTWSKILKGMLKMYQAEVFGKFPVVQHFYFGGVLFPWTNAKDGSPLPISTGDEDVSKLKKEATQDWV